MTLLDVRHLQASVSDRRGTWPVLQDISFHIDAGETLGLVGESGCGKSLTALSVLGLLPRPALNIDGGSVYFEGADLTRLDATALQQLRGDRIAVIFQDPMTALNPVYRIRRQFEEVLLLHRPHWQPEQRLQRMLELLRRVGMPAPLERLDAYPHQLSGGMRQRVTIAMALACEPRLLIADEPTTALDVTVQAQVLALMRELQAETGMAMLFITHDLGVIAQTCQRVAVMYAGRIVEQAPVAELFDHPRHPYTRGLLASLPAMATPGTLLAAISGQVPELDQRPVGCAFANRCTRHGEECAQLPPLRPHAPGHDVACFFPEPSAIASAVEQEVRHD